MRETADSAEVVVNLVDSRDWPVFEGFGMAPLVRLYLLDHDIASAQLALESYRAVMQELKEDLVGDAVIRATTVSLHHAKVFVCAMRRAARVLESLAATKAELPQPIADVVSLVWRKKKAMLGSYCGPRNAVEHIDGEITGKTNWTLVNLVNDALVVTPGVEAAISSSCLNSLIAGRNEILESVKAFRDDAAESGPG